TSVTFSHISNQRASNVSRGGTHTHTASLLLPLSLSSCHLSRSLSLALWLSDAVCVCVCVCVCMCVCSQGSRRRGFKWWWATSLWCVSFSLPLHLSFRLFLYPS